MSSQNAKWRPILSAIGLLALTTAATARAADYIDLGAQSTSGSPVSVQADGSSLVDLARNLIDRQSDFAPLAGHDFQAALNYGGVKNAILFQSNAGATNVTLTFPSTGFSRTFTGTDSDDVKDQIVDFLKKDGADAYADLLQSINEQSPVAALDGNPQAATAFFAGESFKHFGLTSPMPMTPKTGDNNNESGFNLSAGSIQTDAVDGYYISGGWQGVTRFTDQVALSVAIPVQYRNYQSSEIFTGGVELGLPITLINDRGPLAWQITPFGTAGIATSVDLVSGGILVGGGVTNRLALRLGQFTLAMGNQFAYYHGQDIDYDDYSFQTHIHQPMLTNGGQITWSPGPGDGGFFIDAGASYTAFLDDAAVPSYWSPTLGLGFHFGKDHASTLRIAYHGDFGHNYDSHGATFLLSFNY
jgi:hypothetical protein